MSLILGTGNYKNVLSGNTVSITGDGGNAWGYFGPAYKKMAPKLETYLPYKEGYDELQNLKNDLIRYKQFRKEIEDKYIKSFYNIRLKNLDIDLLFKELKERFGENIIFLCHEDIEEFCHRRLLVDFLEIKTGIYIPEVSIDKNNKIKYLKPIRYIDKLKEIM